MKNILINVNCVLVAGLLLLAGCRTSEQIQAGAPQPAVTAPADAPPAEPRTPLTVILDLAETELPEDVTSLRIRIPEMSFRHATGTWHSRRTQGGTLRIDHDAEGTRTLLTTSMPHGEYQAVRFRSESVYVEFGENAGAPLTVRESGVDSLVFPFEISREAATTLRLRFDVPSSLTLDENCRWHFEPVFEVDAQLAAPVADDTP